MKNHGNDKSEFLNQIADQMTAKYGEYITSAVIHNGNPEFNELELEVRADSQEAASNIAVKQITSEIRTQIREHPDLGFSQYRESAESKGDLYDTDEFVYFVTLKEIL